MQHECVFLGMGRVIHTLEALARRCYWGDKNESHTGYKACLQLLFGKQCKHEPYIIIHAKHADKYMVDYVKDGVTNRIYSPFEYRMVYHNASAPPEGRLKRNTYLIFLEPPNIIRQYPANMVGATTQTWSKRGDEWRLSDCLEYTEPFHDEMKEVVITNIAELAEM